MVNREIPKYEDMLRNAGFKSSATSRCTTTWKAALRSVSELMAAYRDLLKESPLHCRRSPWPARRAATMYGLRCSSRCSKRAGNWNSRVNCIAAKAAPESTRKMADGVRLKYPGSDFAADADKLLQEIDERNTHAEQELSKINKAGPAAQSRRSPRGCRKR